MSNRKTGRRQTLHACSTYVYMKKKVGLSFFRSQWPLLLSSQQSNLEGVSTRYTQMYYIRVCIYLYMLVYMQVSLWRSMWKHCVNFAKSPPRHPKINILCFYIKNVYVLHIYIYIHMCANIYACIVCVHDALMYIQYTIEMRKITP